VSTALLDDLVSKSSFLSGTGLLEDGFGSMSGRTRHPQAPDPKKKQRETIADSMEVGRHTSLDQYTFNQLSCMAEGNHVSLLPHIRLLAPAIAFDSKIGSSRVTSRPVGIAGDF
jgi:hypothetical protein